MLPDHACRLAPTLISHAHDAVKFHYDACHPKTVSRLLRLQFKFVFLCVRLLYLTCHASLHIAKARCTSKTHRSKGIGLDFTVHTKMASTHVQVYKTKHLQDIRGYESNFSCPLAKWLLQDKHKDSTLPTATSILWARSCLYGVGTVCPFSFGLAEA